MIQSNLNFNFEYFQLQIFIFSSTVGITLARYILSSKKTFQLRTFCSFVSQTVDAVQIERLTSILVADSKTHGFGVNGVVRHQVAQI